MKKSTQLTPGDKRLFPSTKLTFNIIFAITMIFPQMKSARHFNATKAGNMMLCLLIIFALHPLMLLYPANGGLDNSWPIGIQLAIQQKLLFGKEIIFTYGPLGFLVTRCPIGLPKLILFCFDIFVIINLTYILFNAIKSLRLIEQMIAVAAIFFSNDLFNFDIVPLLFIVMGYYLIQNLNKPNLIQTLVAAVISLVLFFLKLNFGLFSIFIFVLFIIYLLAFHPAIRKTIYISMAVYTAVLITSIFLLNVSFPGYIVNSAEIVKGYPGAMYSPVDGRGEVYLLAAILLLLFATGIFILQYTQFLKANTLTVARLLSPEFLSLCFTSFFVALTSFILFKQAFTRADEGHYPSFFKFILPLCSLGLLTVARAEKKILQYGIMVGLTLNILVIQAGYHISLPDQLAQKYEYIRKYYRELVQQTESPFEGNLPPDLRKLIGHETIDILPTEISLAYFNQLNYKPRPIFQTYSAYTEKLDEQNAISYRNTTRPSFLLFAAGSIDNRYYMWDESKTKLEILQGYNIVKIHAPHVLFQKSTNIASITEESKTTLEMNLGEYATIDSLPGLCYARIYVKENLLGKAINFLFQPPDLYVTFLLTNGTEITHRAVRNIIEGGVLINKYIPSTTEDLASFYLCKGGVASNVSKIKFTSNHPAYFKKGIDVEVTNYTTPSVVTKAQTLQWPSLQATLQDGINQSIDKLEIYSDLVELRGWAFLRGKPTENLTVKASYKGPDDSIVAIDCFSLYRPDITQMFGENKINLDQSGFLGVVSKKSFKTPGTYTLYISIMDNDESIISTINTQKTINIP